MSDKGWGCIPVWVLQDYPYILPCKYNLECYCIFLRAVCGNYLGVYISGEDGFRYKGLVDVLDPLNQELCVGSYDWRRMLWQAEWHYEKWWGLRERFEL